ncbi:O-antigen/teichoic acid export membrane protein [Lysobacter niastensis]|uniref:O-antigen/teichoic acid export membrane protein n=1 Tax=Lysobacter niastensis TaxID=380629 RepID=A0ABU1WED4_9GAMM|nr:oligosaccharide flippase family protein [Lysobacter niastensis]MDR7135856.1 O-antigen/teichoic acid export membrane protein [Lysobacter niastensis]
MIGKLRNHLAPDGPFLRVVVASATLRVTGMAFGLLVGIQLARLLGAEGYGVYGVAMSVIALLTVAAEFGLSILVTREVASAKALNSFVSAGDVLAWANKFVLLCSLALIGGMLLLMGAMHVRLGQGLYRTLAYGLLLVPVVALASVWGGALRGLQNIAGGQFPDVLLRPALFSLLLLLVHQAGLVVFDPTIAMILGLVSAGAALLVSGLLLRRDWPTSVIGTRSVKSSGNWLRSAAPMALSEGVRVLQAHLVIIVLGVMAAASEVGLFRVAVSVSLLITLPVSLLNVVSSPMLAKLHAEGDLAGMQRLLFRVSVGMTVGVILLCLPFVFFGRELLGFVFGQQFSGSLNSLLILSAGALVNAVFGAAIGLLNMTGHEKKVTRAFLVSLLFLAIMVVPLTLVYGGAGAALASSATVACWNWIMWKDAMKHCNLDASIFGFGAPARRGVANVDR